MKNNTPPHKRYYLHRKVKQAFQVNATRREVVVPAAMADSLEFHLLYKYIKQLQELGYNIQLSI